MPLFPFYCTVYYSVLYTTTTILYSCLWFSCNTLDSLHYSVNMSCLDAGLSLDCLLDAAAFCNMSFISEEFIVYLPSSVL